MCAAQVRKNELPKQIITVKLRLRDKHCADLNRRAQAVNIVWNYCNETSAHAWDRDRKWLSGFDLAKLSSGTSKIIGLHSGSIAEICHIFYKSKNKNKKSKLKWRCKKSLGWVPFDTGHVKFDSGFIKFNGISYSPMHIPLILKQNTKIGAGSFNQDSKGRWYINLPIKIDCKTSSKRPAVGVDLGFKSVASLSNGHDIGAMNFYRKSEKILATSQRGRKTKRTRAIHAKIANRRKDFLHKESAKIAQNYGLIFVGDVSAKKIAQTKMAKSLHDASWGNFKNMLSYKAIRHGGRMIEVDERYTTQTCSSCGSLPPSRPRGIAGLGIREWTCDDCGTVHDRDTNAAKNILRIGLDTLEEGAVICTEQPHERRRTIAIVMPSGEIVKEG